MIESITLILAVQSALRSNGLYVNTATVTEIVKELKDSGMTIPVRCKDCKHRTLDFFGGHCCRLHKGLAMVTDESFCSYGERKDNE